MENSPKSASGKKSPVPYVMLGVLVLLVIALIIGVILLTSRLIEKHTGEEELDFSEEAFTDEVYETVSPDYQSVHDWWEGDWYGWWIINASAGSWDDQAGCYWDACARIRFTDETTATVTLWDEDHDLTDALCTAEVTFDGGMEKTGCMVSQSGRFMDSEITYADWVVDPALKYGVGDFSDMVLISGFYVDPENEENGFEYYFFLRPWGMEWEDVRTGDTSQCAFDPMMPGSYDDWYLPLLRSGASAAPASFYN